MRHAGKAISLEALAQSIIDQCKPRSGTIGEIIFHCTAAMMMVIYRNSGRQSNTALSPRLLKAAHGLLGIGPSVGEILRGENTSMHRCTACGEQILK